MIRKILVLLLAMFASAPLMASTCTASRTIIPSEKLPFIIKLVRNAIFEKNNPGKIKFNQMDKDFPYGLSIVTANDSNDVSVILTIKGLEYSQTSAEGAFNSKGKFEAGLTLNSDNFQDIINVVCIK